MAPSKARDCPCCGETRSGRSFKGHPEQCTVCRRNPDLATQPIQCSKCKKAFSKECWFHEKTGRGWRLECNACHAQTQKIYNADIENKPPRTCIECHITKPAASFQGPRNTCRPCKAKRDKQKAAMIPKADSQSLDRPSNCSRCGKIMDKQDFTLRTDTHLGSYRSECRGCRALALDGTSHSENSRKRQRERPDYPDIKRHKNETHQQWIAQNPTKPAEYQAKYRTIAKRKMQQVIQTAKQRNIVVVEEDMSSMEASLCKPCFYCGYQPEECAPLNGLDRVDSSIREYSCANTVPCCTACNRIKACRGISQFIIHMRRVAAQPYASLLMDATKIDENYRQQCQHRAPPEKKDMLDMVERRELQASPCEFCKITPSCGVDRLVSADDYTSENVQPCCQECNYGKSSTPCVIFRSQAIAIANHTAQWTLQPVTTCYNITSQPVQPVACFREDELMGIFFTITKAADAVGEQKYNIVDSMASGNERKGFLWKAISYEEYSRVHVSSSAASNIFMHPINMRNQSDNQSGKKQALEVREYDGGPVIHQFTSVTDCAGHFQCNKAAVSKALSKGHKVKGMIVRKVG